MEGSYRVRERGWWGDPCCSRGGWEVARSWTTRILKVEAMGFSVKLGLGGREKHE